MVRRVHFASDCALTKRRRRSNLFPRAADSGIDHTVVRHSSRILPGRHEPAVDHPFPPTGAFESLQLLERVSMIVHPQVQDRPLVRPEDDQAPGLPAPPLPPPPKEDRARGPPPPPIPTGRLSRPHSCDQTSSKGQLRVVTV